MHICQAKAHRRIALHPRTITYTLAHGQTARYAEPRLLPHISTRISARTTAAPPAASPGEQRSARARRSTAERPLAAQRRRIAPRRRLERSLRPLLPAAGRARSSHIRRNGPVHLGAPGPAHTSHTGTSVGVQAVPTAADYGRGAELARFGRRGVQRRAHGRVCRSRIELEVHFHDGGGRWRPPRPSARQS